MMILLIFDGFEGFQRTVGCMPLEIVSLTHLSHDSSGILQDGAGLRAQVTL